MPKVFYPSSRMGAVWCGALTLYPAYTLVTWGLLNNPKLGLHL